MRGQGDDAVDKVGLDDLSADLTLAAGVARQTAVGHDEAGDAPAPAVRVGEVMDEVLYPGVIGVADGRVAIGPPLVAAEQLSRPVADVEGWVGEDEVGFEVRLLVVEERVCRFLAELGLDTMDGQVHVGEAPSRGVALLPKDGNVGASASVGLDKLFRLNEHTSAATRRIVDAAFVGFQHLNEHSHDAARRIELAAQFPLGSSELAQEVLVDPSESVAGHAAAAFEANVGNQVDETFHFHRLDAAAGVVAGKLTLEVRVVPLDCEDRVVDQGGDVGTGSLVLKV